MKKRYMGLFLCLALTAGAVMGGCSSSGETENTTEETAAENDTEESADAEEQTENTVQTILYQNDELGFSAELPALLEDCMYVEESEYTAYDDTVNVVRIYVDGGEEGTDDDAILLTFEEMSQETWDAIQAEGGPLPDELGVSSSGRVVTLSTVQSNPFAEGTEAAENMDAIASDLGVVRETFKFLDE